MVRFSSRPILLVLCAVIGTGCSSLKFPSKASIEPVVPAPDPAVVTETVSADSTFVEDRYTEQEAVLSQILGYYDEARLAFEEGNYAIAETKIDSAAIISSSVDLSVIEDSSLLERYLAALSTLFQEHGRMFVEVTKISEEDPLSWLDDYTMSDPDQFKNGNWDDEVLRPIIQKIVLRCDVPIDYNEQVKSALYFFQTKGRDDMAKWRVRSGRFLPMITKILEEEGLPLDMAYLAMIESGFSARAYSRAHASGLWQFIYATGRLYGLKRTSWIDERRDPEKSTRAAVQHLKDLYKIYDDWRLVMAAYNCGPSRVSRQYRAGNDDFWSMNLPRETRNYVPLFMAAVIIAKAPEIFGFENITPEPPLEYDLVEVHPYTDVAAAAKYAGFDQTEVNNLNLELLNKRTPPGKDNYLLKIPKGKKEQFETAYASLPREVYSPPKVGSYIIRRGDTLSEIADRFGIRLQTLMAGNNISAQEARRLRVGRRLVIPGRNTSPASTQIAQAVTKSVSPQDVAAVRDNTLQYTVKRNDSLWLIARNHNTSIAMIQALNNMGSTTRIVPGQNILVPAGSTQSETSTTVAVSTQSKASTTTQSSTITYIIRKNDTLYDIAQKYGVTHQQIMEWNKIKNHRTIKPGDKIIIQTKG